MVHFGSSLVRANVVMCNFVKWKGLMFSAQSVFCTIYFLHNLRNGSFCAICFLHIQMFQHCFCSTHSKLSKCIYFCCCTLEKDVQKMLLFLFLFHISWIQKMYKRCVLPNTQLFNPCTKDVFYQLHSYSKDMFCQDQYCTN